MQDEVMPMEERIQQVMMMAKKLEWIKPPNHKPPYDSYETMQVSEVEKVILAVINPAYYEKMKRWCGEAGGKITE